jgi:hypothetical protein
MTCMTSGPVGFHSHSHFSDQGAVEIFELLRFGQHPVTAAESNRGRLFRTGCTVYCTIYTSNFRPGLFANDKTFVYHEFNRSIIFGPL